MSDKPVNAGRRRFIRIAAVGAAAAPLGNLLLSASARAQDRVDPADSMAQSLQYTENSPKEDQHCSNCQLYGADASAEWAPCPIFAGKLVKGSGWCTAWVAKT